MLGKNRDKVTPIVRKIGQMISFLPLTPTQFTFLAVIFAGLAAYFIIQKSFLLALIFVIIAGLWDLIDGSFARAKGKKSYFGNYWDAMTDRVVEAIIYFGLAFLYPLHAFLAFAFSIMLSYAKPRVALVIEADNHDWPAIGERIDRVLLLIVGLFIVSLNIWDGELVLKMTLKALIVVTALGFIQRVMYAKKLIEKAKKDKKILPYLLDKESKGDH